MTIGEQVTAIISYAIIAFSAIFGMYNSISYLYFAGENNLKTMIFTAIYEYCKGAIIGGAIFETAIVIIIFGLAIWQGNKQLKFKKFLIDVNANIIKVMKTALMIMIMPPQPTTSPASGHTQ